MDNGSNGSVDETTSYTYDANDRLQQELLDTDGLAGAERTTTYTYNNTVQTGKSVTGDVTETHTYDYDAMGRMESSTIVKGAPGSETTTTSTYTYNADGIRVQQSVIENGGPATVTKYHYDANNHTGYAQVLEEKNNTLQVTKAYTLGHDVVAQADVTPAQAGTNAGTALAFLYDGHGSTRALLTPGGIILNDGTNGLQLFTYDAYGNLVGFTGTALTRLLYSGELTDATTGLQYLRARYYDAAMGRFTRSDPADGNNNDPLSLHKYLYTHSNPVMGIDPTGMFEFSLTGLLVATSIGALMFHYVAAPALNRLGIDYDNAYFPDAAIIGVQGSSTKLMKQLFNYLYPLVGTLSPLGTNYLSPLAPIINSGKVGLVGGIEILFNIRSSQIGVYALGGVAAPTQTESGSIYTGLVWNTDNVWAYEGRFYSAGYGSAKGFSGSFFTGDSFFSKGFNGGQFGFSWGRSFGSGAGGVGGSLTYYKLLGYVDLPMEASIAMAAAWGAATNLFVPSANAVSAGFSAIGASFWPYTKWAAPKALAARQTKPV